LKVNIVEVHCVSGFPNPYPARPRLSRASHPGAQC